MPFGDRCQYKDFESCVKANSDKRNPRGYCAFLMKRTEQSCKDKAQQAAEYARAGRPTGHCPTCGRGA